MALDTLQIDMQNANVQVIAANNRMTEIMKQDPPASFDEQQAAAIDLMNASAAANAARKAWEDAGKP